jgi:hypothetical protein
MKKIRVARPSPGLIVAIAALVVALSGVAVGLPGRNSVDSGDIQRNAVTTKKIKKNAVTSSRLAGNAVTTGKIGPRQVTAADLARPPRLIEYSRTGDSDDEPMLTAGELRLRADCAVSGGSVQFLIEAATSSGTGTIESSGIAEAEGGGESSFVNGPIAVGPSFTGVTSISDANVGAAGADGNFKLLFDGPGVVVSIDLTVTATHTPSSDTCAASGIAVSAG